MNVANARCYRFVNVRFNYGAFRRSITDSLPGRGLNSVRWVKPAARRTNGRSSHHHRVGQPHGRAHRRYRRTGDVGRN